MRTISVKRDKSVNKPNQQSKQDKIIIEPDIATPITEKTLKRKTTKNEKTKCV